MTRPEPASQATAPGKVILLGEHAVVYGQPALAVPVTQVRATATVSAAPDGGLWIRASNIRRHYQLEAARPNDPLALAVRLTLARLNVEPAAAALRVTVDSSIPIASGLGSGAAVCTAVVRALSAHLGRGLNAGEVSAIVFETEKLLHGTPSGIDNTVVAYGQPVYFVKGHTPTPLSVAWPFELLIGDTGAPSPTRLAVEAVRAAWQREPERYEALFSEVGAIVREARQLLESAPQAGRARLGALMSRNHELLREMGVSSRELDTLVEAARGAGALGAKLSGGGRGGNMIALVSAEARPAVKAALRRAGARRIIGTMVDAPTGRATTEAA